MKYKIYHIPGVKIGCTTDIQKRVVEVQGYKQGEYEILFETDDLAEASGAERVLQEDLGYKVDMKPYIYLRSLVVILLNQNIRPHKLLQPLKCQSKILMRTT